MPDRARESKTMPASDENITEPQCWVPPGMVRAVDLTPDQLRVLVTEAGWIALREGVVITITGSLLGAYPTGYFCRLACQYSHDGSVIVMPDLLVAEFFANGGDISEFRYLDVVNHRSVAFAAVVL